MEVGVFHEALSGLQEQNTQGVGESFHADRRLVSRENGALMAFRLARLQSLNANLKKDLIKIPEFLMSVTDLRRTLFKRLFIRTLGIKRPMMRAASTSRHSAGSGT
jgi:hypothetical protein